MAPHVEDTPRYDHRDPVRLRAVRDAFRGRAALLRHSEGQEYPMPSHPSGTARWADQQSRREERTVEPVSLEPTSEVDAVPCRSGINGRSTPGTTGEPL